jgi:cell division protein FtsL
VYDHSVDDKEHSIDEWKRLIFEEVTKYEQQEIHKFVSMQLQQQQQQQQQHNHNHHHHHQQQQQQQHQ